MRDLIDFLHLAAERRPDSPAVVAEDEVLSYAELARRTHRIAHALRELGVGPEVRVGLCVERGAWLVAALLGVLAAGGAYVPLDPEYPRERLALMLADSGAAVVITQEALRERLPAHGARVLDLDADRARIEAQPDRAPPREAGPESLAYVIYTSGSTGTPKGVLVTRRGLAPMAIAEREAFGATEESRVLAFASICFDASVFELAMALGAGASLHVGARAAIAPGPALARFFKERAITHATLPPSALAATPFTELPALRVIVCAGEACPVDLAKRWSPGRRFFNAYGPTEATVWSTLFAYDGRDAMPIGRPVAGARVELVDARMRPVAAGELGEIVIGGPGVARGYHDRPDLTADRFVPDPADPAARRYRTGDLARLGADGELSFAGRVDHQIKVRGFRIEPGEIEAALLRHAAVREAVVVARADAAGDKVVVAYLALRAGFEPDATEMRAFLARRLPEHLLPASFVALPALPRSHNDKVDRAALPAPGSDRPRISAPFVAPRTEVERSIAGLWSDVLGVRPIGVDDDFFALGGDSLRAARIAARAEAVIGRALPTAWLAGAPTIARLAARMEAEEARDEAPIAARAPGEPAPLSFAQERLFFLHQLDPESRAYHIAVVLRLRGALDRGALEVSLEALIERHAALSATFEIAGDRPVQIAGSPAPIALPITDAPAERLAEVAREGSAAPFDLRRGPLFRARLVRAGEGDHALILAMHHLVADGVSMGILGRELVALYDAFTSGHAPALPALPVTYAAWAAWQRAHLTDAVLAEDLAFFRDELAGAPAVIDFPAARPRPPVAGTRGAQHEFALSAAIARPLLDLGRAEGASAFTTLFTVFAALVRRHAGARDLVIGTPVAARDRREIEGVVGFFAGTLALRARLDDTDGFRASLARSRAAVTGALAHQRAPFERVVEHLAPARDPAYHPLFQLMFALQPAPFTATTASGLEVSLIEPDSGAAPFDLFWQLWETPDGLAGAIVYRTDLFDAATIARFAADFATLAARAAAEPDLPLAELVLTTDRERRLHAALPTIEAAILADPAILDAAVRLRPSASRDLDPCAYVVSSEPEARLVPRLRARLDPDLVPSAFTVIPALPIDARGAIDEGALQRSAIADADLARRCEAALRALPGVIDAAVVARDPAALDPPGNLHITDLVPDYRSAEPEPTLPATVSGPPSGPLAPAYANGGPLVLPEGAPPTLVAALFRTATRFPDRGITYVEAEDRLDFQSYPALVDEALRVLAGLAAKGLRKGARVILQLDSLRAHFTAFWACLLGGITPVTVAVAPSYEAENAITRKIANTYRLLREPAILTSRRLEPAIAGLASLHALEGLRVLSFEDLFAPHPSPHVEEPRPEDVAFFQLTSGSTGVPKCIQETHGGVVRHVHSSAQHNGYRESDVSLNWLPLDHVVPILTCHLKDTYLGLSQIQVKTDVVLARPLAWLDLAERYRVTHTWSPNFGYKLVADALAASSGRSWDLSSIAFFMNAGEQVTLPVVRDFLARVAPFGVRPRAMQPAFGMAEVCTCMTWCNDFDAGARVHRIAKASLGGVLVETGAEDAGSVSFVDLGPPSPGVEIRIADAEGRVLPEGVIGRLQIRGGVVTPGYLDNPEANREAFVGDGWFNTGDLGFLRGGRLTLTGREKEIIIVRGANLYAYEIEDVVSMVPGVVPTFAAACAVDDPQLGTEGLAIFFVSADPSLDASAPVAGAVRAAVTARLGIAPKVVIPIPREEFPKTTSGKIQRSDLKKALAAGRFRERVKEIERREGGAGTVPDWFCRPAWRRKEAIVRDPAPRGAALVLRDRAGLADAIAAGLAAEGRRAIVVEAGDLDAILAANEGVDDVVHLLTYGDDVAAEVGVEGVLALAQALAKRGRAVRLVVASTMSCEKAPILGVLRTLPQEAAWIDARHVDFAGVDPAAHAPLLLREIASATRDREVRYRDGERLVRALEKVDFAAPPRGAPLTGGGVYLVTGGLGGLGLVVCRHLLERHRARVLVIGRSDLDANPERAAAWRSLVMIADRTGGAVRYARADVTDEDRVAAAVAAHEALWGAPLAGIFHLAGTLEPRLLAEEARETFAAALAPKVRGSVALHRLAARRAGCRLVLFSSVNGFFGGFSAGAYSAACAFADAFADATGCESVAWSQWDEVGMSRGSPMKDRSRARGFLPIPPEKGLLSLLVALARGEAQLLAGLDAHGADVRRYLAGALDEPRFDAFVAGTAPASPPVVRDRFGAPVAYRVRAVARIPRLASGEIDAASLLGLAAAGRAAGHVAPRDAIERTIAEIFAELLGVTRVGVHDNFFDLGGHSMLLAQARVRLERALGREVAVMDLFRRPTVASRAAFLGAGDRPAPSNADLAARAEKQRAAIEAQRRLAARGKAHG